MPSPSPSDRTIVVFARAAERGRVKTRLARTLGDDTALALHRAFVEDACALTAGVAERRYLAVAGALDEPSLGKIARAHGLELVAQEGADLGSRMAHAIATHAQRGPVCIIGADSPSLPRAYLEEAFVRLAQDELVLGPATDGGYWLVGARRPAPELFGDIAWGTPSVLPETLRRLAGARAALLPFFYDVDDEQDLALLRAHLGVLPASVAPATRQMLAILADS
jgi:rSAM/selenodomain-associated transferase 1